MKPKQYVAIERAKLARVLDALWLRKGRTMDDRDLLAAIKDMRKALQTPKFELAQDQELK
tara:strand:+ start:210 stop:389 length:180 start_codon:yes stop_codon:yes gene_type:complete